MANTMRSKKITSKNFNNFGNEVWPVYAKQYNNLYNDVKDLWDGLVERIYETATGVAAAGTTLATATQLTAEYNEVTSCTGASADGVKLHEAEKGLRVVIKNDTATDLNVYPYEATSKINDGSAGVAVVVGPRTVTEFQCVDDTYGACLWECNLESSTLTTLIMKSGAYKATITMDTLSASRIITIPEPGATSKFVLTNSGGTQTIASGDIALSDGSVAITDADNANSFTIVNNTITTADLVEISSTSITTGALMKLNSNTATADAEVLEIISAGDATSTPTGLSVTIASVTTGAATGISVAMNSATTTATGISVTMNALTTGTGIAVNHTTGLIANGGSLLKLTSSSANTATTNGAVFHIASTNQVAGNVAMISAGTTTGNVMEISATNQTSGNLLLLTCGGAGILTGGAGLSINFAGATVGSALEIEHSTGTYTGTDGVVYVNSSGANTGIIVLVRADGVTTGDMLYLDAGGDSMTGDGKFINCNDDNVSYFSVANHGQTTITSDTTTTGNAYTSLTISKDIQRSTATGAIAQTNEGLSIASDNDSLTGATGVMTIGNNLVYIAETNSSAVAQADVYSGTLIVGTYSATTTGSGTATNTATGFLLDYNITMTAGTLTNDSFNVMYIDFDTAGSCVMNTGTYNLLKIAGTDTDTPAWGTCTYNGIYVDLSATKVTDATLTLYGLNITMPTLGTSAMAAISTNGRIVTTSAPAGLNSSSLSVGTYATPVVDANASDNFALTLNMSTATSKTNPGDSCMGAYVKVSNTADTVNTRFQGVLAATSIAFDCYDAYGLQSNMSIAAGAVATGNLTAVSGKVTVADAVATGIISAGLFTLEGAFNPTALTYGVWIDITTGITADSGLIINNNASTCTNGVNIVGAYTNGVNLSTSGATSARGVLVNMATTGADYGDGYAMSEFNLNLTGSSTAGHVAALGAWINATGTETIGAGGAYVCSQSNGVYGDATAVMTGAKVIFGMRAQYQGDDQPSKLWAFSVHSPGKPVTAIFETSSWHNDTGFEAGSGATGACTGYLRIMSDTNGSVKYVRLYDVTT